MIILKIHRVVVLSIIYIHVKMGNVIPYNNFFLFLIPFFLIICSNLEIKKTQLFKKKFFGFVGLFFFKINRILFWVLKFSFFLSFLVDKKLLFLLELSAG